MLAQPKAICRARCNCSKVAVEGQESVRVTEGLVISVGQRETLRI